jgi:hypothetical protein
MTPGTIRQKTVAAKAQGIREMLAACSSLPLASADSFAAAAELYEILTKERGDVEAVLAAILAWLADHPQASTDEL